MHDGVNAYIDSIASENKKGKENFLIIYKDFIDANQESQIIHSIDDDIICEFNKEISDVLETKCDMYGLRNFANSVSNKYYRCDSYVQDSVRNNLIDTIIQVITKAINEITITDYDRYSHSKYNILKEVIETNKFISVECLEKTKSIVKDWYRSLFCKHIFDSKYEQIFVEDFKDVFDKTESDLLVNQMSEEVINKSS